MCLKYLFFGWTGFFFLCCTPLLAADTTAIQKWNSDAFVQLQLAQAAYEWELAALCDSLQQVDEYLNQSDFSLFEWREALKKERSWRRQVRMYEKLTHLQMLKVRYRKGLDLIQLLYEKILALDHHFSGMQIYQQVFQLSNPNSYPEFQQVKLILEENLKKKHALKLPELFYTNPYLSATYSIVASLLGDGETKTKESNIDEISCILDFTVRMHSDLGVIQNETEYLKAANQQIRMDCERLFEDYVKVVEYLVPLSKCRERDDWETLYLQLDRFVMDMEQRLQQTAEAPDLYWNRAQVNLEFSTQRVAEFINQYINFITLGTQYYQKFHQILTNYEEESSCSENLPHSFEQLKKDIEATIDKFQSTYQLPEIQGSRMKDLLYGIY